MHSLLPLGQAMPASTSRNAKPAEKLFLDEELSFQQAL